MLSEIEGCCTEFREEFRQALGSRDELPDDWENTAVEVKKVFDVYDLLDRGRRLGGGMRK